MVEKWERAMFRILLKSSVFIPTVQFTIQTFCVYQLIKKLMFAEFVLNAIPRYCPFYISDNSFPV
jgi:hypothetical protein